MPNYVLINIKFKKQGELLDTSYILAAKAGDYEKFKDFSDAREEIVIFTFGPLKNETDINGKHVFTNVDDIINEFCKLVPQYTKISIKFERGNVSCHSEYYMIDSFGIWGEIDAACGKMKGITNYEVHPIDREEEKEHSFEKVRIWANVNDVIYDIAASIGPINGYTMFLFAIYKENAPRFTVMLADEQYEILDFATGVCEVYNAKIHISEYDTLYPYDGKVYTSKDSALSSVRKYYRDLSIQYKKQ